MIMMIPINNMDHNFDLPTALMTSLKSGLNAIDQTLPPNFSSWIAHYQESIASLDQPKILLLESDPLKFCAAAIAFFKQGQGSLFLGNPTWKSKELSQVAQLLNPDRLWGSSEITTQWLEVTKDVNNDSPKVTPHWTGEPLIYFPTGGSSGKIQFATHSLYTLETAVMGLKEFLQAFLPPSGQINSFCVLPLFHVGGWMQWWRSALTEGQFCVMDYATVKNNLPLIPEDFVTSLVPTQLQYLLDYQPQFLKKFRVIFLGGAPAWPELLTQTRQLKINLAPTYGATETAGQISTLLPTDFLEGKSSVGKIIPYAKVVLKPVDLPLKNQQFKLNGKGLIIVRSNSLFLGYYPQIEMIKTWQTGDLGELKDDYLQILGRQNRQIISGGENIDPLEIENWLLNQNLVKDIVILGLGDRHWGEVVTAVFVPQDQVSLDQILHAVKTHLAPHKCPKHWLPVPEIRRSPLGKINYAELQTWAKEQIISS